MTDLEQPQNLAARLLDDSAAAIERLTQELTAAGFQTPFLAMDQDKLLANIRRWREHLPHVTPFYAVKANVDPLVLEVLLGEGIHADVASAFEVEVCHVLQVAPDRMILSNPRKDLDTIRALKQHKLWATTVDSEVELNKLADEAIPSADYHPVLFLRIKVPTKGVRQDLSSKFGVRVVAPGVGIEQCRDVELQLDELLSIAKRAAEVGFKTYGIAFYVGTQCTDGDVYAGAIEICLRVGGALRAIGLDVGWIDIGGGFADGAFADEKLQSSTGDALDQLLAQVGQATRGLEENGYQVIAEPGRTLVADAGVLVTRVSYDRSTNVTGRRIQIDDGVYRTLSGRVHDDREFSFHAFRIGDDPRAFLPVISRFAVWGCSCDSFDKVADEVILPADLQVGDFLMLPTMGAYSSSFGLNTNGFQPATIVRYHQQDGRLHWRISPPPLAQQNRLLLDHIRHWYAGGDAQ